jgi:nicotinamide-nucleotide adenylyltransferase
MPKKEVGLFVGRFQPFHSGHLAAVKYALKRVNYLYIVVGSAQRSHERDNPFTAGERIMMIKAALDEAGVDGRRWMLIPVHDAESHSVWTATLRSTVPKFDIVFSNDTLTIRLLKEEGIDVVPIRARILERRDWEKLVPPAVARLVKDLDGVGRVRSMINKDTEAA